MLSDLVNLNLFAFFLFFARIGTAISLMPGFSASYVPARMRMSIALAISFILLPALAADLPVLPAEPSALALLITGGFLGMIGRILIGSLQTAGTLIAYTASMANALINDPIAEQQSSTVSGFLLTSGLVLVFVTDMHHLMLQFVASSYDVFIPGAPLPVGDFSDHTARLVTQSFALGLQLTSPFIIVGLTYYIGLGLLGRLMPTLHVFFFGLPFQLTAQIWVLMVTTSGILLVFLRHFKDAYMAFLP